MIKLLIIKKTLKIIIRMVFHILIIVTDYDNVYVVKKTLKIIIRITQNSSLVTTRKA